MEQKGRISLPINVQRRFVALLVFAFVVWMIPMLHALAAVPLMPVSELQVGSHGIGRTVIEGTRIEEFGVEILGIMKNRGPVGDLILVRTYGDVIERAGGVAQGMSGSPVFIGGRLVGAIAYGWTLTDGKTAMITPIHDMLKLFDRVPVKLEPEPAKIEIADTEPDNAAKDPIVKPAKPNMPEAADPMLATPVMASGFTENALSFLKDKLRPLKLTPYSVGDPPMGIAYGDLEPGSAVGVQLIRGDVSLGALGTVTYVDDNKVLAFGHPFLKRGATSYFLTNAYIFTTVRSIESSFKVGSTGAVIGSVNQDRSAGIAGEMNRYPGVLPMRMNVRDSDFKETRRMEVQVVQDEEIAPILATAALLSGIEKTIDRSGAGTARVIFEISARGMPGETFRRENMFYSPENISLGALAEFYEFFSFLAANPHNKVTIMDVQADVSVTQERRTARILSAHPLKNEAAPGDTVDIEVKLKPYREAPITRTVSFTIPKDQAAGSLSLSVRGGGFFSIAALMKKLGASEGDAPAKPTRKAPKSFEQMMKEFISRDRNNDIVVEISGAGSGPYSDEDADYDKKPKTKLNDSEKAVRKNTGNDSTKPDPANPEKPAKPEKTDKLLTQKSADKPKSWVTTDYIIEADTEVTIEVVSPAKTK